MLKQDIIVIGTSTGGIETLKQLAGNLPRDFSASILVVLHVGASGLGILPEILRRAGPLPASNVTGWEPIQPGHIHIAPPDHHLLVEPSGYLRIRGGQRRTASAPRSIRSSVPRPRRSVRGWWG